MPFNIGIFVSFVRNKIFYNNNGTSLVMSGH
jgi:hypothetical protein